MKARAIGLVSGGLDSMIATRLMMSQGVDVFLIMFASPFFHSALLGKEKNDFMDTKATIIEMGEEYLNIIKNPEYGYGSGINPCIDCKIHMLKIAARIMEEKKASFIFTGEVLNQRPFSQTRTFMQLTEKKSGLKGRILRPLSAKLLDPTVPEIEGLIDREKLLAISGRQRKQQLYLAEKLGIVGFSQPAGGCLLTDRIYSEKLNELIIRWPDAKMKDAELIKHGRVFWHKDVLIVIGRNKIENELLANLAKTGDLVVYLESVPGPLCVVRGKNIDNEAIDWAKKKVLLYARRPDVECRIVEAGKNEKKYQGF
ncbi:MAG: tRNA 4-thiouridine(8) synthase ThiI [Candidatus Omnitrophica bacterium]|nr:tRNA 4-thiouridine(8) synthase ThiI [Candidatus Omnitrophota bacterium]